MTKRKTSANSAPHEESLYYWWFRYLAASDDYAKCCDAGGRGPFKWVYDMLGDVRQIDFASWWAQVSEHFIVEPYTVRVVTGEGDAAGVLEGAGDDLLVYVNLWAPEAKLLAAFRKVLRESQSAEQRSAAMEPLQPDFQLCLRETNRVAARLKNDLRMWDAVRRATAAGRGQWEAFYTVRGEKPPRRAPPNRSIVDTTVSKACSSVRDALDGLLLGVFPAGPDPHPAPLCPPKALAAYRKLRKKRI